MNSPTYLIVGCGYFGSRAAEKLLRKDPKPKIVVVDRNKEAVKNISNLPAEPFAGDGLIYLEEFFSEGRSSIDVDQYDLPLPWGHLRPLLLI